MKLQPYNYTGQQNNNSINTNYRSKTTKNNPSFGNLGVGLATFIENNGFLGEFLTIDTVGMMAPRTGQGYLRNRKELGHLNYKAGREEAVRELLSGPAFFYVPLTVLTLAGILRGKSAKVQAKVLDSFKPLMKNTAVDLKNAASTKSNFVKTVVAEAFKGYNKETALISQISDLMNRNVTEKLSFVDRITNIFKSKANKKTTPAMLRAEADKLMIKLNKANGKFLDSASTIEVGGRKHDISTLFKDMSNYLDDFTQKAAKTSEEKDNFIEKFHKKAKQLRYTTNILAVGALSAFLSVIPKLYQTGDKFPGTDGLTDGGTQAQPSADSAQVKEAA